MDAFETLDETKKIVNIRQSSSHTVTTRCIRSVRFVRVVRRQNARFATFVTGRALCQPVVPTPRANPSFAQSSRYSLKIDHATSTMSAPHELAPAESFVWSFGFGSNMNVALVESKKGYKVHDHIAGVLPGWKVAFNLKGPDRVEEAWANAMPCPTDPTSVIHGVAIKLSLEDAANLDSQERGYQKANVVVNAYDGRTIEAYVYTKETDAPERRPSKRYLNVLLDGARDAGLDKDYITRLAKSVTYIPSDETLALRRALPAPESLPPMTVAELAAFPTSKESGATHVYTACYGYVVKIRIDQVFFGSHIGRDITGRASRQWRGLPLNENDDMGTPPFRTPHAMGENSDDEREFVWNWFDHYLGKIGVEGVCGFLTEYRTQLDTEQEV